MNIEEKCIIIEEFTRQFSLGEIDREFFTDFVIYNDLGVPLAQLMTYSLAEPTEEGIKVVEETWRGLCETLDLDPDAEYDDFDEMIEVFEEDLD